MNHVYRVIWNGSAACWQAVSETARGKSKSSKSTTKLLKQLALVSGVAVSGIAAAAPVGGVVASGTASIGTSGSTTTINQSTAKAIINWNDFSIANGETVNFVQPDTNAIALNRVVTATPSSIQGALNANGQVFIVNPNGITFGSTAQVNVGGLVASTLDITDSNFNNGTYRFNGSSSAGITNQGAISVTNTGTAALIAPSIQQAGSIVNNDGTILLTAASDVSLSLSNRVLSSQSIHAGHNTATINHSAGLLQADGGKVLLNAQGVNSSSTASISSAGTIRAQTLAGNDRGAIDLIADSASGVVNLTGTLDASAPTNGFGGTIRTIGADVAVANSASVTTRKVNQTNLPGTSSHWQIKANSINVGTGGTISGSELSSSLNDGSVTLTASGTGTGQGSININEAVSTNSNVILSLAATKDVNFNNNVGLTANLGRLILSYGSTNDYNLNNGSKITLSGAGATLRINNTDYTIINSLGVAGDTSTTTLQGMKNNLTGNYALGSDIDASATSGWNGGKGFDPIGRLVVNGNYSGQFHGLGHTVNGLTINRPTEDAVGLFGLATNRLRDVHLLSANVTGRYEVGALAGQFHGVLAGSSAQGIVNGNSFVGGLIGTDTQFANVENIPSADIKNSHADVDVTAYKYVGGLAGFLGRGTVIDSSAHGEVTGIHDGTSANPSSEGESIGGLVGIMGNLISNSYATGNVTGKNNVGGLVGLALAESTNESQASNKLIENSYATGQVTGEASVYSFAGEAVGGLVGHLGTYNDPNFAYVISVSNSYASGNVDGINIVGGLIGHTDANASVTNSYAKGGVTGTSNLGGLIGTGSGTVSNSYWDTTTSGQSTSAGGTGKTTAELKQISTFSGWDIADVSNTTSNSTWVIDENNATPWLR